MTSFQTSPKELALIIADSHLPLDGRKGAAGEIESFRALLKNYSGQTKLLVLLGDIFDFWYEWHDVVPKRALPLLYDIHDIVRGGIPVHFFAGNHDFKVSGFLEKEIGMVVHLNEWITTIDGKKVYFHHGDGKAASDKAYRSMKKVFRNRIAQWLFGNIIHPDLAMLIGRVASERGEKNRLSEPTENKRIPEYRVTAGKILKQGVDLVIFGHTHKAELIKMENGIYHNPGPFLAKRNYAVIEGGLPINRTWK